MELYESVDATKVIFAGLDKAGKTSIILALQKELSQLSLLKPTRMAERKIFSFLGRSIATWDLGGQERYRAMYLEQPSKYFDQMKICIFVIDIQDEARFEISLKYLKNLSEKFKGVGIKPVYCVFFHKIDPDYKNNNEQKYIKNVEQLKEKITAIISDPGDIQYYETTIYGLFTITGAFTKLINANIPNNPKN